jgi:hypothetical protein
MNNFMTSQRENRYQHGYNRSGSSVPYHGTHFNRHGSSKIANQWVRAKVHGASQIDGPILSGPSITSWRRTTTSTAGNNPHDKPGPTSHEYRIPDKSSRMPLVSDTSTANNSATAIVDDDKIAAADTLATLDANLSQNQDETAVGLPAHTATPLLRKGSNKLVRRSKQSSTRVTHGSSSSAATRSGEVSIAKLHINERRQHPTSELTMSPIPSAKPLMKRCGPNKLVLKKELPTRSTALQKMAKPPNTTTAAISSNASDTVFNSEVLAGMKSKGHNKLVSQSRIDEEKRLKQTLKRKRQELKESAQVAGLTHKGHNKLVSETRALQVEEQLKEKLKQRLLETRRNHPMGPVKRVRVQDDTDDAAETELTDFAYQHTSQSNRRNMGLVRVVPKADAPICPTFSQRHAMHQTKLYQTS